MGSMLKGSCECGFESEIISAGGGMSNFQEYCGAPAICLNCKEFLVLNYMNNCSKCPSCGYEITFYNDPSTQIPLKESYNDLEDIFKWHVSKEKGDFWLLKTSYLCPKCGKMTLTFELVGLWD